MTSNVNVINKAGNSVDVKVSEMNGAIQIVIDVPQFGTELALLSPGDVFEKNGVQYIVCEQLEDGTTAVVRKDCLDDEMEFGSDNDWKNSDLRTYLNEEYYNEIKEVFGEENIVNHEVDLTSLDGYDDYGVSTDKVSVMNIDRYRKYHRFIGNTGCWHWLSTPNSTPSGTSSSRVRYVYGDGCVRWGDCRYSGSVRPFFILKSTISVSFDKSRS